MLWISVPATDLFRASADGMKGRARRHVDGHPSDGYMYASLAASVLAPCISARSLHRPLVHLTAVLIPRGVNPFCPGGTTRPIAAKICRPTVNLKSPVIRGYGRIYGRRWPAQ